VTALSTPEKIFSRRIRRPGAILSKSCPDLLISGKELLSEFLLIS